MKKLAMDETDVLVLGGGPAGAAAAITLAQAGVRCTVLESQLTPVWKIGETLAPEARQFLQAFGLEEMFVSDGHLSCPGNCSVWGGDEPAEKNFTFNPYGGAWQLDRAKFEATLLVVAQTAGARVERGTVAQSIRRSKNSWEVTVGKKIFRACWLIDASGRGGLVARNLRVARTALDQLVSVHAVVSVSATDTDARTWIEAVAGGWWYSALLPGGRRVFSFQTDPELLPEERRWRSADWFRLHLGATRHLCALSAVANMDAAITPKLTSAQSARLDTFVGDRWLAVGDAAQSFDPLSGEGLFYALLSGQRAAQSIAQHLAGASNGLADYAVLSEALWRRFLHQRQIFYACETRWPDEPFWQRRLVPIVPMAQSAANFPMSA
jgi:flavin-dependent dehydrogenase